MGQQPNIELDMSDLPRPSQRPAAARPWRPDRPGDIEAPRDMPEGRAFGSTGPDSGYALRLVRRRELAVPPNERQHNAEVAVAAVAAARAAAFGRAPVPADVDIGALVLGYDTDGIPADVLDELAGDRFNLVANLGHAPRKATALVALVPDNVLTAEPDSLRQRLAAGERLLDR